MEPGLLSLLLLFTAPQAAGASQAHQLPQLEGQLPAPAGGYTWERVTPGNTGIPGDYVNTIFVDGADLPWIAAYVPTWDHGGMAHFDGEHWITVSNVDHEVIRSSRFNDIVSDAQGVMWIGSDHGLLRYDPAIGPVSLRRWDRNNSPLPGNQIDDLALDPAGGLWIADREVGGSSAGGLAHFDPVTEQFTVWTTANGLPWGAQWPGWDWVEHVAVVPESGGDFTVWFHGAVGMATWKAGSFTWFGSPILGNPTTPRELLSNDPVDGQGNLWMDTSNGIARLAPDGTYTVVGNPPGLTSEVSRVAALSGGRAILGTYYSDIWIWDGAWSYHSNWIGPTPGSGSHTYALREDSEGNLWAGGIGGASKFEDGQWQQYRMTNTGMLGYYTQVIVFDGAGNVLMNGNSAPGIGGFTLFDGTDWTCVNDYNYGLGPSWGLPSDDVAALWPRANGDVAVAPLGGQGVFDWDGTTFTNLVPQGYDIERLVEDNLGRLWAARGNGYGVFLLENGQSTQFVSGSSPLLGGSITSMFPDPEAGFIWMVSAFGVLRTDGVQWDSYPRSMLGLTAGGSGFLTCGDRAADGTLWLGTDVGLYHFNPVTGAYTVRAPANSTLPSDDIRRVAVAPDGSVWCSTFDSTWPYPGGLTHFQGAKSVTFTAADSPLPHNQTETLAVRAVGNSYELWVGSASGGATIVRPAPKPQRKP